MKLGQFAKSPVERKRYALDYTDWLDTGETVNSVTFTVTPSTGTSPLLVDSSSINASGTEVRFFVSSGDDGANYTVTALVQTSGGQIKQDEIVYLVRSL